MTPKRVLACSPRAPKWHARGGAVCQSCSASTAGSANAELAPTGKPLSAKRAAGWARGLGDGWKRAAGTDRNVIEARVRDEDHDCDTTWTYQAAPQHRSSWQSVCESLRGVG